MSEPSNPRFKPGDVVTLRSGGPVMTVARRAGSDLDCWFFVEGGASRFTVLDDCLMPIAPAGEDPRVDAFGRYLPASSRDRTT
jgi:uncharacterized protein YodC (DUF2158 family)